MARFETHFTLDQANALLPWVRSTFTHVHEALGEVAGGMARVAELSLRGSVNGTARGHKQQLHQISDELERQRQERLAHANALLRAIVQKGIVIQDVAHGLIDFPAWRGDTEVLLCFELADGNRIGFWHHLDAGYAGRQPIEKF